MQIVLKQQKHTRHVMQDIICHLAIAKFVPALAHLPQTMPMILHHVIFHLVKHIVITLAYIHIPTIAITATKTVRPNGAHKLKKRGVAPFFRTQIAVPTWR